jgi:hypothetical protein
MDRKGLSFASDPETTAQAVEAEGEEKSEARDHDDGCP